MSISGISSVMSYQGMSGMSAPPPPMSQEEMDNKINDFISGLDEDGDGALSLEESGVSESDFTALDTDGDGLVTADEINAEMEAMASQRKAEMAMMGGGPPPPPPEMSEEDIEQAASDLISELDSDGDGGLSLEESGAAEEEFDELDTNQDGMVSAEELAAAMQTMASQGQAEMAGGPQGPPPPSSA